MPSLKQLRRRIRTVENTKLITRAMRSVAASKMRRTQDQQTKTKPYTDHLQALIARVVSSVGSYGQPLMEMRERQKSLLVIFSSDRGLCGAFNATINRFAQETIQSLPEAPDLYIIGRRANSFFNKRGYSIVQSYNDFRGNIDVPRILNIGKDLQQRFLNKEYDKIELVYNRAITAMNYRPERETLLPLDEETLFESLGEDGDRTPLDYIFEPDAQTVLKQLLPKYLDTKILFTFIDTFAAEHQARMIAMTTANNNCEELMETLTLQMNKARQNSITNELLDIVGGAEALRG